MSIEVKSRLVETDEEGYLLKPGDWDEEFAQELIRQHETEGHIKITETGWELIRYFRDYYEDHMMHPSMHRLLADRAKGENKHFEDEKSYQKFLYELFPHGPVRMLGKLAGLPNPEHEIET